MKTEYLRRINLRKAIDTIRLRDKLKSDAAFCDQFGLTPSHISQMIRGKGSFGEKVARDLESQIGLAEYYLDQNHSFPMDDDFLEKVFGKEYKEIKLNETSNQSDSNNSIELMIYEDGDPVPDGYTAIDYYDDVFVSAGSGYLNLMQPSAKKFFVPTYLMRECNVQPSTAKVVKVRGDSMFPVLQDGQPISVDMSAKRIIDGEIYAFQVGDETKIKYLSVWNDEGKGGFKAISANQDKNRYPDEYYSPARIASEGVEIIGQYWMKLDTKKIKR
ncbi:S24 family peptidase [Acinetobacter baumannii]|uniref:S24 family peptidase n=1 Tax=Acinetobacter calcoaceticus/baumannii complex TaxID=909768 RepID=UPI00070742D6|nr:MULTISPECIES: S24 family peptidase [Acinetobacter calcoaceticus/baumannii complex]KQE45882.1 peptidase S24 [Acinetobacter baumannii]MCT2600273.1 S24 family peptidase [Acinetobacter baumannii]MDC9815236.1 S24 family peptidase [Acinetobacter nosocomialis]MDE9404457.1 S24 family peptidase [Acinetobacter nosocomialis]HAV5443304.1 S24 family peptidase [Acinetobacter baumannii]